MNRYLNRIQNYPAALQLSPFDLFYNRSILFDIFESAILAYIWVVFKEECPAYQKRVQNGLHLSKLLKW